MSQTEEYEYWFGEVVDKLISSALAKPHGPASNPDKYYKLYDAARVKLGRPLTLMAAEKLKEKAGEGQVVLIITNSHEMDGPPGAAVLARAVDIGLKAKPVLVSAASTGVPDPAQASRVLPYTCIGAGLQPVPVAHLRDRPHRVSIVDFTALDEESTNEAKRILDEFKPAVVVATEAPGRNRKGVYHGAFGFASKNRARTDSIMIEAGVRHIPTVALGDNGNEMGFGTIEDAVRKIQKYGDKCRCECGSGIASAVKADIVIPANNANWGCYGVAACLARILKNSDVIHDGETERRILYNCANEGCPEGSTGLCTPTVDHTPHKASVCVVELLKMTVTQSFLEYVRTW